jgi:hypothetical protein
MGMILLIGVLVLGPSLHGDLAVLYTPVVVYLVSVESLLTIKVGLLHAEETKDGDQSAKTCVEEL